MSKVGRFLHIREASRATSKASSASNTSDRFLRGGILARLNRALAQFQQIPQRPLLFLFFSLIRGQARPNVIVAKLSGHAKQVKAVKASQSNRHCPLSIWSCYPVTVYKNKWSHGDVHPLACEDTMMAKL